MYKKSDDTKPENYKPISLMNHISKIFETLLLNQMTIFFSKSESSSEHQNGFQKKRSRFDEITYITKYIMQKNDQKESGVSCFIDFQKAFNPIDRKILLQKPTYYNFGGPILKVSEEYLNDRFLYVQVRNTKSNKLPISYGVPQGSILDLFFS